MAKALKHPMREIAVIPCGGVQGWRDLRQNRACLFWYI